MGASIPLPALDIRTPSANPNLLEQFGKLQALQNMQQQQTQQRQERPLRMQALQQQVQGGQVDLQQKQQQQADQQAVTKAMTDWDGKDYNDIYPAILRNGGSAQAVIGLKTHVLQQQTQIATQAKDNAQGAQAGITATLKKNDLVTGAMSPLMDSKQIPDDQLPTALTSVVQSLAQQGALDPPHAQAAAQLAQSGDPAKIRQGIAQFRNSLMAQSQITEQAAKDAGIHKTQIEAANEAGKTDPNSPLYSPTAQAVAMGTAQGSKQIEQGEARLAGKKAGAEESARLPGEMALAQQRQALSQGDPNAAGRLLVNGDATLSELKSRGATPDFIAKTLDAAHQLSGGQYNAQQADAAYSVAKSPTNVAFFGSAKSLTNPGGTLDQLAQIGKTIPGNQIPAFNSIADWEKAATGNGALAKYASTALGVADDYAKVMGGGQGSDTSRLQALNLIKSNASPEARAGAIDGIRGAVNSQIDSRVGSNPILKRMYGGADQSTKPSMTPKTHQFSLSAWQKANPSGDPNAAKAAAQQQGFQVVQ